MKAFQIQFFQLASQTDSNQVLQNQKLSLLQLLYDAIDCQDGNEVSKESILKFNTNVNTGNIVQNERLKK